MINFVSTVFKSLDRGYLIRNYLFGLGFFIFLISTGFGNLESTFIFSICLILYPFSMYVYDSIINLIMGNNVIEINIIFMLSWKVLKVIVIFYFSFLIAPIGIIYLYLKNRNIA